MKKITRIVSVLMALSIIMAIIAIPAFAACSTCGSTGERTYCRGDVRVGGYTRTCSILPNECMWATSTATSCTACAGCKKLISTTSTRHTEEKLHYVISHSTSVCNLYEY